MRDKVLRDLRGVLGISDTTPSASGTAPISIEVNQARDYQSEFLDVETFEVVVLISDTMPLAYDTANYHRLQLISE
jgi:hypothetical protein